MKSCEFTRSFNTLRQTGHQSLSCPEEVRDGIDQILETAYAFFQDSEVSKRAYQTDTGEGYRAFANEYTDSPTQPDLVECFSCSLPRSYELSFPTGAGSDLYNAMIRANASYAALAEQLARGLFTELDLFSASPFDLGFLNWSRLQVNYGEGYRASRDLLHVLHEDGDLFTIAFATAPGLELITDSGPADLWQPDNCQLTLLAGGILTCITKSAVRTGFHQVRCHPEVHRRLAILYFADFDPRAVERLRTQVTAEQVYEQVTQGWLRSGVAPVQTSLGV